MSSVVNSTAGNNPSNLKPQTSITMESLKKGITKAEAKQELASVHQVIKAAARGAKNVQTKDYLNIFADNLIPLEKLADARTK